MKLFRKLLKACSLTTVLFIFQACYGTYMPDNIEFSKMRIRVTSSSTGKPVGDVAVSVRDGDDWIDCGKTDTEGILEVYSSGRETGEFRFDSDLYEQLDTTLVATGSDTFIIPLREK